MTDTTVGLWVKNKGDSFWWRLMAQVPFLRTNYYDMFTTIGQTVWAPEGDRLPSDGSDDGRNAWCLSHQVVLAHEAVHVRQWEKIGAVGFLLAYLGPLPFWLCLLPILWAFFGWTWVGALVGTVVSVPLTFGFCLGRWVLEREAYMVNIVAAGERQSEARVRAVHRAAEVLSTAAYGWCWPRKWMLDWFWKRLEALDRAARKEEAK